MFIQRLLVFLDVCEVAFLRSWPLEISPHQLFPVLCNLQLDPDMVAQSRFVSPIKMGH